MEADITGDSAIVLKFGIAITTGVIHFVTSFPDEVDAVAAEMAIEPALDGSEGELTTTIRMKLNVKCSRVRGGR